MIRWLSWSLKILLTVVLSWLVLEILLLGFNDVVFRNSFYRYDPDMGYRVAPYAEWGAHQANEFGFNDRDYPHQKPANSYRILVVGDSFNWAGGPEGNYTAILEQRLNEAVPEKHVEVINIGYSGTHTGEQLPMLRKFGLQYRDPDVVVLGFFVGNDFYEADPFRRRIAIAGSLVTLDTQEGREMQLLGQPFTWQSRLYLFLYQQWQSYRFVQQANAQTEDAPVYTADYLAMEYDRMQLTNWNVAPQYETNKQYAFQNILAMRDLVAAHGGKFVVAAYPDEFQVDERLREAVIAAYEIDPSTYQWDLPQGVLWLFCTENNIEFYDLLPPFREAHQSGQRLYLPNDSHWNEAGNQLAADYLFEVLVWKVREG